MAATKTYLTFGTHGVTIQDEGSSDSHPIPTELILKAIPAGQRTEVGSAIQTKQKSFDLRREAPVRRIVDEICRFRKLRLQGGVHIDKPITLIPCK